MNVSFFIARRYLVSKKSHHAINIISAISVVGVAVATLALVCTLSVFNGFRDLVAQLFTSFDPQLEVTAASGVSVPADDPVLAFARRDPDVAAVTECMEDQALALFRGRQAVVTLKGVDDNFVHCTDLEDILYGEGTFMLHAADRHLVGLAIHHQLIGGACIAGRAAAGGVKDGSFRKHHLAQSTVCQLACELIDVVAIAGDRQGRPLGYGQIEIACEPPILPQSHVFLRVLRKGGHRQQRGQQGQGQEK